MDFHSSIIILYLQKNIENQKAIKTKIYLMPNV